MITEEQIAELLRRERYAVICGPTTVWENDVIAALSAYKSLCEMWPREQVTMLKAIKLRAARPRTPKSAAARVPKKPFTSLLEDLEEDR